jgi:hypothetical protein
MHIEVIMKYGMALSSDNNDFDDFVKHGNSLFIMSYCWSSLPQVILLKMP